MRILLLVQPPLPSHWKYRSPCGAGRVVVVGVMLLLLLSATVTEAGLSSSFNSNSHRAEDTDTASHLLELHRYYVEHPPHDRSLYDILQVNPQATTAQITHAYRRLSRQYHPDKQQRQKQHHAGDDIDDIDDDDDPSSHWTRLQQAYEILKSDRTRLPYHQLGLTSPAEALLLLTGRGSPSQSLSELGQLLHLVGLDGFYDHQVNNRVDRVVAGLVEQLRPYLEGWITLPALVDVRLSECDRLKHVPLGAQILRCVGRAYRHAGRTALYRLGHKQNKNNNNYWTPPSLALTTEHVREHWKSLKHAVHAAVLGGQVVWAEHQAQQQKPKTVTYYNDDNDDVVIGGRLGQVPLRNVWKDDDDDDEDAPDLEHDEDEDYLTEDDGCEMLEAPTQKDLYEQQKQQAQTARLEALQLQALWKISKIDLDRIMKESCKKLLQDVPALLLQQSNEYFAASAPQSAQQQQPPPPNGAQPPPPQQQPWGVIPPPPPPPPTTTPPVDGWVSTSSIQSHKGRPAPLVHTEQVRWRAAHALAVLGDAMVQSSKQDTGWRRRP